MKELISFNIIIFPPILLTYEHNFMAMLSIDSSYILH